MKATFINYQLDFKMPAGTSRGILLHKPSSFIILEENGICGIGECSVIPNLSIDPMDKYDNALTDICKRISCGENPDSLPLNKFPSIAFGLETALLDLKSGGGRILFQNDFSKGDQGILINGLVWMGNKDFMQQQISEKITTGYRCIKLKVGALDFETEVEIIRGIREKFSASDIEIRLDANGGFSSGDALNKLDRLSAFSIHSIEQPIPIGQWQTMASICSHSPIPIALDEELIGQTPNAEMLATIQPAYIILKPSLLGGFHMSEKWIQLAEKLNIGWWATSALEGNIGLNAIAQWASTFHPTLPQGLGTGQLYKNNISSPLEIRNSKLFYNPTLNWDLHPILQ